MKRNLFFLGATVLLFVGCTKDSTLSYRYQNNFENYAEWGFQNATLRNGNAHSGSWFCELDSNYQYSIGFTKKLSELPVKNIKTVKLSAWIYLPAPASKANVVMSIGLDGQKPAVWNGLNTENEMTDEKSWTHISGEFSLPPNLNPEYKLSVYVWNHGKQPIWCDDLAFDVE
jgi:hypothetical protein